MTRTSSRTLAPRSCWVLYVLLALALLLAGCGVPDQRTAQNQTTAAAPTATASPQAGADVNVTASALMLIEMQAARATAASDAATVTAWAQQASPAPATSTINTTPPPRPTFSPAELTQAALGDAVATASANYFATADSLPPAPQDGPLPVYPTPTPWPSGIFACESVDPQEQFAEWSCWQDVTPDRILVVSAGGASGAVRKIGDRSRFREDNATIRGGLGVCIFPRDNAPKICDPTYWRPEKEGRLKIVAVAGMRLTLEAVIGSRYVFNVETRQWEAAPAVPVPTATPLPTDVPPPTFTPLPIVTGPEIDATKAALMAQLQNEMATYAALPSPMPGTLPIPTDQPTYPPIVTGINFACIPSPPSMKFSNCWFGTHGTDDIAVFAGIIRNDPSQGIVVIQIRKSDEAVASGFTPYNTPEKRARVMHDQVEYPRFFLRADDETPFIFNVETRAWEASPQV